jgi:hypothetical protein
MLAGESGHFQQLRSISHGLCAGESGSFQQPRSTSHGPLTDKKTLALHQLGCVMLARKEFDAALKEGHVSVD